MVGLSGPALGRLAVAGMPVAALAASNLALLVYDWVTRRQVHRVYVFGVA